MKLFMSFLLVSAATLFIACGDSSPQLEHAERDEQDEQIGPFGQFSANPQVELQPDGRTVKILQDLAYTDPTGVRWEVATGSIADGASIPQAFWSFFGGPFEGQYRDASIVHDIACDAKTQKWHAVHEMFYNACRCRDVSALKSKMMYAAVYHFGPRWPDPGATEAPPPALNYREDYERLQLLIATDPNIEIKEMERLTAPDLRRRVPDVPVSVAPEPQATALLRTMRPEFRSRARHEPGTERMEFRVRNPEDQLRVQSEIKSAKQAADKNLESEAARLITRLEAEPDQENRMMLGKEELVSIARQREGLMKLDIPVRIER